MFNSGATSLAPSAINPSYYTASAQAVITNSSSVAKGYTITTFFFVNGVPRGDPKNAHITVNPNSNRDVPIRNVGNFPDVLPGDIIGSSTRVKNDDDVYDDDGPQNSTCIVEDTPPPGDPIRNS